MQDVGLWWAGKEGGFQTKTDLILSNASQRTVTKYLLIIK
jgi:hypothetical protein